MMKTKVLILTVFSLLLVGCRDSASLEMERLKKENAELKGQIQKSEKKYDNHKNKIRKSEALIPTTSAVFTAFISFCSSRM